MGMTRKKKRADYQVNARVEHQVDFTDIVGGACHCIADRLQVVKGHAFAEQGDVQLIAGFALQLLAEQLRAEVAAQLQHATQNLCTANRQGQWQQDAGIGRGTEHGVESIADQHRHNCRQRGVTERAHEQDDDDAPMADGM